jgi:transcriptional regulator with XRE-family HTH domain
LTPEESAYVELKVALGSKLKELRSRKRLSQVELARRMGSSQSRVAKIEAAESSVSLDLLVRSLIALGASRKDLARAIASSTRRIAA